MKTTTKPGGQVTGMTQKSFTFLDRRHLTVLPATIINRNLQAADGRHHLLIYTRLIRADICTCRQLIAFHLVITPTICYELCAVSKLQPNNLAT
jgi:hypothetical protein